jgi:hypothetical protein
VPKSLTTELSFRAKQDGSLANRPAQSRNLLSALTEVRRHKTRTSPVAKAVRFCVLTGSASSRDAADPPQGDIANSGIENTIHELIPFLAVHHVLSDSEDLVGKLRFQVFRRIAKRGLKAWLRNKVPGSWTRCTPKLAASVIANVAGSAAARIRTANRSLRIVGQWAEEVHTLNEPKAILLDFFQGVVSREFDVVSKHLQLAAESCSLHVSLRNIDVTFRLSRWVTWLTLAVTAMTGLGLLANWPAITAGLKLFIGIFHR